jgi:murein hydrolase activator
MAAALLCALPTSVSAQATEQANEKKLERIERSRDDAQKEHQALQRKADALEREVENLRQRSIAVAARAQEQEETLTRLEDEIRELRETEQTKIADLMQRRDQLAGVLAALQRLSLHPPIALAVDQEGWSSHPLQYRSEPPPAEQQPQHRTGGP